MEYKELFSNNEPDIYSSDDEEEPYLVLIKGLKIGSYLK